MMRQSGQKVFAFFAALGYLLLIAYFGLMAFANFFGRNPNPGLGSFAILVCIICAWRFLSSMRRIFRKRVTQEEGSNKTQEGIGEELAEPSE